MLLSLYIHFPFCRSKCIYCDFCSFASDEAAIESYCSSLMHEIELAAEEYPDAEVPTLYFGGGTPSVVPAKLMWQVTEKLRSSFRILPDTEFTSEANPGTVTHEWLEAMAKAGMNRLSLGVQARQDRLLKLLGRIHRFAQVEQTLKMARGHGINNLSIDLMYGLPTQTAGEYLESIRAAAALGVQHISAYALKVEDGTPLQALIEAGTLPLPDEDDTADMMEQGIALLEELGYHRYEISNFAKTGYESGHNMVYWRQQYYLGLGLNAASMLPDSSAAYKRRTNTASLHTYKSFLVKNRLPVEETAVIQHREAMFETIMLGLRTIAGVRYADFETMHGQKLEEVYGDAIAALGSRGWLLQPDTADPHLALNARGLAMQNSALMLFMDD